MAELLQNPQDGAPPGGALPDGSKSTAAAPTRKGCLRRALGCCLGVVAVPLLLLLAAAVWLSIGPAPAPAYCLPPDAELRAVVRDPAGLADEMFAGERWQELRAVFLADGKLPDSKQSRTVSFLLKRAAGGELAVAKSCGGDGAAVAAMRPGMLFRAFERLLRLRVKADADGVRRLPNGGVFYAFIGKTLVVSRDHEPVAAALARREEIFAAAEKPAPPAAARVELRLEGELSEEAAGAGLPAFILDLPCPARGSLSLRTDAELRAVSGQAGFAPDPGRGADASGALPPPLPVAGPVSARLVPADALGYWVWQAPPGEGRWQTLGRFRAMIEALGGAESGLGQIVAQARDAGADPEEFLIPGLAGERSVAVVAETAPDGTQLLPAVSVMIECADPQRGWPAIRETVEALYGVPAFDEPPVVAGKTPDRYLLRGSYRGVEVIEAVYARLGARPGFRPACAVAGKFAVFSSSRAELERIIDRAAGRGGSGPTLAGSAAVAPRAGQAQPPALLVLSPRGRGRELIDLALALRDALDDDAPPPDQESRSREARDAATMAALLSAVEELRVEWRPDGQGGVRLELEGELRR